MQLPKVLFDAGDTSAPFDGQELRMLTAEESEQVGGGLWPLVIGIAIGCALLLAHD